MTTETINLKVEPRESAGKKIKHLRQQGRVPGVLYGYKVKNQPVECPYQEFHKTFVRAGESTIVELHVGKDVVPVLIHSIACDPVTGNYAHIDFLALDMTKEVTTHVPVQTTGESPGVKELAAILVHNRDTLTVKCLPKDLPHALVVDISGLKNFHDTVTVAKIKVPPRVVIVEKPEEIVVSIQPPRKEEEVVPVATAEGIAGAEGAVTAAGEAAAAPGVPTAEKAGQKGEKEKGEKKEKGDKGKKSDKK